MIVQDNPNLSTLPLVLASTSPYRKNVLNRLHIPFTTFAPNIDETPQPSEFPTALVARLSESKTRAAQSIYPKALVIGSDQIALLDNKTILGKPGGHEQAVQQLSLVSGKQVDFLTGLCLLNTESNQTQIDIVRFSVIFRELTSRQIENYLRQDKPYNCSGSFKSEGLGIVLIEQMLGNDPTAIIGLPLIRLVRMLEVERVAII